jgi:D-glycero-D-manno-heptose 1,7-bisphosphate phosphatase
MPRPAVFLDRDGTLHRELADAPRSPEEIEVLAGAPQALARLAEHGYVLVVVTNQSAIARGTTTFDELREVHRHLAGRLAEHGATIAAFYVCPHHPSDGTAPYVRACACRKPAPGLLARALAELDLDPARSWIVGDALRDLEAGWTLGIRPVLVRTGKGAREEAVLSAETHGAPAFARETTIVADLKEAAETILRQGPRPGR